MLLNRSLLPFAAFACVALAAVGCSSNDASEEAGDENTNDKLVTASCELRDVPNDLAGFKGLDACELGKMFGQQSAKDATVEAGIPSGPYDGVPLCRKELLRVIPSDAIPANIKAITGFGAIWKTLELSDGIDNAFAGRVWKGKYFTPPNGDQGQAFGFDQVGDVNNFIDITTGKITDTETARRSAEAKYYVEKQPERSWLTLNYKDAQTGIRVLTDTSVKIIRQVYDTARLVNKQQGIYLGMAWMINTPGEFPNISAEDMDKLVTGDVSPARGQIIPSCYFALKKHVATTK